MLNRAIDSYLRVRRAAGFELKVYEGLLRAFACFASERAEDYVRRQTAIDWAGKAPSPGQRERRLGVVRRFAQHARAEQPAHELIPRHVFAHKCRRLSPYIFSPAELRLILDATSRLRPKRSLRPQTYYTFFGLLAATGLRVSEAMRLVLGDVTTDGLVVRETKFHKNRLVPLHETTAAALEHYLKQRRCVAGADDHVFISTKGRGLTYAMANGTFHYLCRDIRPRLKPGQRPPGIHNIRHTFAVRALEACTGGHAHIARHILALSTYLGHTHVTDTYWYLQATPHLMAGIADACETFHYGESS